MSVPKVTARVDSALCAVLVDVEELLFSDGADPVSDHPAHVRAGSAIRHWRRRIVVVQDDVHVLALQDDTERYAPLLLPPGSDGRRVFGKATGNKSRKMDLEACVTLPDGRLLALGSGSRPERERLVVVTPDLEVRVVEARDLFARFLSTPEFSGSELNIEGAIVVEEALRLLQRGNGAPRGDILPVNAMGDLPLDAFLRWLDFGGSVPELRNVRQYDLGSVGGVLYGFTDATLVGDAIAFVAGAEDSPDTYQDGDVLGALFGVIRGDEVVATRVRNADGEPTGLKIEGVEWLPDRKTFLVVADMDDERTPARVGRLDVTGF